MYCGIVWIFILIIKIILNGTLYIIMPKQKRWAMITKITLKNFKNFVDTTVQIGPVTTLIGTNASGKSNIKDAFRILHGISRGYTLAEAIGEKWGEGGIVQWRGIRGGTREMIFQDGKASSCSIEIKFEAATVHKDSEKLTPTAFSGTYGISIGFDKKKSNAPVILAESFKASGFEYGGGWIIKSLGENNDGSVNTIKVHCAEKRTSRRHKIYSFRNDIPVITQLLDNDEIDEYSKSYIRGLVYLLKQMRFLDVSPEAMRQSSLPGQTKLSDRGENLSSVLQTICDNEKQKGILLEWLRELTPQDVIDLEFREDFQGKVIFYIVESGGRKISAYSASEGTLRFLAIVAALLSLDSTSFYFFEEVENGIHPSRLYLLLRLIEQRSENSNIQVVLSSYSPLLLDFLTKSKRKYVSLVYRIPGRSHSSVIPVLKIPNAKKVLGKQAPWLIGLVF